MERSPCRSKFSGRTCGPWGACSGATHSWRSVLCWKDYAGAVCKELQPVRRTHAGEVQETFIAMTLPLSEHFSHCRKTYLPSFPKQAWTSSKRAINWILFFHILFKYLHQWGIKSVYSHSNSSTEMRICAKMWSRTIDLCCFFHFFICYLEVKWEHFYHWKYVKGMQFCLACI